MNISYSFQNNLKSRQSDEYTIFVPRQKGTLPLFFGTWREGRFDDELLERLKFFQQNHDNQELVFNLEKTTIASKEIKHTNVNRDCVIEVDTSKHTSKPSSESPRLQQIMNLSMDEISTLQKRSLVNGLVYYLSHFQYFSFLDTVFWIKSRISKPGKVPSFDHKEKKIALFFSYGLMVFWLIILVLTLIVFWDYLCIKGFENWNFSMTLWGLYKNPNLETK